MALKAIAAGSIFRVLWPPAAPRSEQAEFRLRVLTARQRARLADIQGGVILADGTVKITQGAYQMAALEEGLDGWDEGELVFTEDHDAVKLGKKRVGDPILFQSDGKLASARSLDAIPPDCADWLVLQIQLANTVTRAEKKALASVPELPSTAPSSSAPLAASATVTPTENCGDQDGDETSKGGTSPSGLEV